MLERLPLHRRSFLRALGGVTAGLPCSGEAQGQAGGGTTAEAGGSVFVIDTHMHVWSRGGRRFPFAHPYQDDFVPPPVDGTVETLIRDMDAHGVSHCVLVQVIYHGWDNRYIAHCVKRYPDRLRAHGLIDPTDRHLADKLEYWMCQQGLSGMRFSPIYYKGKDSWMDDAPAHALWKRAEKLGALFNFFISPPQLPRLQRMIRQYPSVPVVIDHLAQMDLAVEDPWPQLKPLLRLSQYPNVSVKVSELASVSASGRYPYRDAYPWVERVYDAFGPDRLLWGTGYPGPARAHFQRPTLQEEISLIRSAIPFWDADERAKILGRNAARLWRFEHVF